MTNPAQLKYLDAMGIPVWVSRDLVIVNDVEIERSSANDLNELSNSVDKTSDSAQSIIDALTNDTLIGDSLNNSEEKVKVSDYSQKKSNAQIKERSSNEAYWSSNTSINTIVQDVTDKTALSPNEVDNLEAKTMNKSVSPDSSNQSLNTPHHHVFTCGSYTADWLVIGHSPESAVHIAYEPFSGDAGELLNNMLKAVGISHPRNDAYLVNIFDANHSSEESAIESSQRLLKQNLLSVIQEIKPKIILLVGQIAAQNLLENTDPLIIMRAKIHQISALNIPSVVTYYPSYLLQKPIDKRKAWEDLKLAMSQMNDGE